MGTSSSLGSKAYWSSSPPPCPLGKHKKTWRRLREVVFTLVLLLILIIGIILIILLLLLRPLLHHHLLPLLLALSVFL